MTSSRLFSTRALDTIFVCFLALLLLLTLGFRELVPEWSMHAIQYGLAIVLYIVITHVADRVRHPFLHIFIRTASVTLMCSFLFDSVHSLQHIIWPGWMDDKIIAFETQYTGIESTLYFQQHMNVVLTEIMMFAYVIYVPLLPAISLLAYWKSGRTAALEYLFTLGLAYMVCYLGFIVYPVASPLYHQRELYTIPLEGGVFTWFGEWMRHNVHHAGGSLPSPHCAAASVMLVSMWKYNRKVFWPLLPVVLVLYVSTVYGRYHYASDGIIGILSSIVVMAIAPYAARAFNALGSLVPERATASLSLAEEAAQIE